MKIIRSVKAMQKLALKLKKTKRIGFVPTMGFLHEGHLRLVKEARKKSDVVVASIFVNPMQFGPSEDLNRYPRDEKGDLAKLKQAGVDYVFLPDANEIYPKNFQTQIEVTKVSQGLCGDSRPGHFRGVATIVLKLFLIVQPDVAVFGKKDFQQWRVIEQMVADLCVPLKIIAVETVREKDGLAKSSRNAYLNDEERELALALSRGLQAAKRISKKDLDTKHVTKILRAELLRAQNVREDYIFVGDAQTLEPLSKVRKGRTLVALAVFVGKTRLIDNIVI